MSIEKLELNSADSKDEKMSSIQKHVTKIFPEIHVLELKSDDWEKLDEKMAKAKHFTPSKLLQHLSEITNIPYEELLLRLTEKKLPRRRARNETAKSELPPQKDVKFLEIRALTI